MVVLAAMISTAFEHFVIGFVMAFVVTPWTLTYGKTVVVLMSSGVGTSLGAFWGYMADRVGRRPVLIVTVLTFSLAAGALALTGSALPLGARITRTRLTISRSRNPRCGASRPSVFNETDRQSAIFDTVSTLHFNEGGAPYLLIPFVPQRPGDRHIDWLDDLRRTPRSPVTQRHESWRTPGFNHPHPYRYTHMASILDRAVLCVSSALPSLDARKFRLAPYAVLGLILSSPCLAQQATAVGSLPLVAIELDKIQWQKNPAGGVLEVATVAGDRDKPGLYIQLVRWPPHTINKAHSHPDDRYAVVLKGTFYHGHGEKFDEKKLESRPVGTFFTEPKNDRHFGITKGDGTILYFVGTGPSTNDNPEK